MIFLYGDVTCFSPAYIMIVYSNCTSTQLLVINNVPPDICGGFEGV